MGSADEESESDVSDDESGDEYNDSSSELDEGAGAAGEDLPANPLGLFVMTFVIGGYTLIGPLQHHLKSQIGIGDEGSRNEVFTQSVATVQWSKTFLTLGQSVLLGCFKPVTRVNIAMMFMFFGTLIPPTIVYGFGSTWIGWVPMSYISIGFALGVFECTYLSVLSPLGPKTKSLAIMGFPAAFAIVNIIGQSLMALVDLPVVWIFWYIALTQPVAIFLFRRIAPSEGRGEGKAVRQAGILESLADWKAWVPRMVPFCFVNIFSHFVMESVQPALFNTYNACEVSLLGPENHSVLMSTTWFMVVLSILTAIADMSSRKIGYLFRFDTYRTNFAGLAFALSCSCTGLFVAIQGVASLAWLAAFLAFFGAGFNYAVTAKYIDKFVPGSHNLVGYSLWMFVGYCGAISGAVLVTPVRGMICDAHQVEYQYQCLRNSPTC